MDMIGHPASPVTFAFHIAGNSCKISVQFGLKRLGYNRYAVFGAEDDMDQDE